MAGVLASTPFGKKPDSAHRHNITPNEHVEDQTEPKVRTSNISVDNHAGTTLPDRREHDDQNDTVVIDWYTADDPANPQNWSLFVKALVHSQINFYTFAIYLSSSILFPAEEEYVRLYSVPQSVSSLGLALYVLGYGIGPMVFSPLSEILSIGRNPPYIIWLAVFVLLSVGTVLVGNVPGFLILRFLLGAFGSPCLATGAASLADVTKPQYLPYGLYTWAISTVAAPSMAPTISGFSVMAKGWRWSMWEVLWCSAPCLVLLEFLPETSVPTILYYRTKSLRAFTGRQNLKSQSEIDHSRLSFTEIAYNSLLIPWKINALDAAILFSTIYIALVFPLVCQGIYGMNLGQLGLIFLTAIVSIFLAFPFYFLFIHYTISRPIQHGADPPPKRRLIPALLGSLLIPAGLFIFAWTFRKGIHWILPTIGFLLKMIGMTLIMQCIFSYIATAYPSYAASLFAMNDFARSTLAFAAVLWPGTLYANLGFARGTSLIAGLTVGFLFGSFGLYWFGPALRERSRFIGIA